MFARLTIDLIRRPSVTEVQSQALGKSAFESVIEIIFRTQSTDFSGTGRKPRTQTLEPSVTTRWREFFTQP